MDMMKQQAELRKDTEKNEKNWGIEPVLQRILWYSSTRSEE